MKSVLKKLKAENSLSEKNYNELYPTGSRIGILYSYKLAKFFIPLLTPLMTSPLIISDSISFVQELLNSDIDSRNVFMACCDVVSLFANIPVDKQLE